MATGKADLVWENGDGGRWLFLMSGSSPTRSLPLPGAAPGWVLASTRNFDADGSAVLLWQNVANPAQYWIYLLNVSNTSATVGGGGGITITPSFAAQPWYGS